MNSHIVIFGASGAGVKVARTFINIGLDFDFFIDNDSNKFGTIVEGKLIRNPVDLLSMPITYNIVIASMYHAEIEEQLIQMGIKKENIVLKEKYILEYIDLYIQEFTDFDLGNIKELRSKNILMDLSDGLTLGGIEKWGITVADALNSVNNNITIVMNKEESNQTPDVKCNIHKFDLSFERYKESIKELVREIISQLPCVIIINRINQLFVASYIVKKHFGDQIKVLSVIHSDFVRMYEQNALVNQYVDAFLCVSNDVKNRFIKQYHIPSEKVFFKDSPIPFDTEFKKKYTEEGKPIVIGYGGRLEKAQKRADLIIPLIARLEEMEIDYRLNIAGNGSYYNHLVQYVSENKLNEKVILFGALPFEKMNQFWRDCDIFINLSDLEGIGLSMLEAMSVGAVPVVTDTAGAKSFIKNDENGYVHNLGDINSIAASVYQLNINRNKLCDFGSKSRSIIKDRCNLEDYVKYIEKIINH